MFHIIGLKKGTGWKFLAPTHKGLKIFSLKKKVGVENLEADFPYNEKLLVSGHL